MYSIAVVLKSDKYWLAYTTDEIMNIHEKQKIQIKIWFDCLTTVFLIFSMQMKKANEDITNGMRINEYANELMTSK